MKKVLPWPHEAVPVAETWLPCHRKSARRARGLLRDFLDSIEDGELFAEVGELVLSELVSNSIRHARVPRDRLIFARFELSAGLLRIEVHDASSEFPTVRAVTEDDEAGRGLWLVEQLSAEWGCCPREGGIGKATWCVVAPAARGAA